MITTRDKIADTIHLLMTMANKIDEKGVKELNSSSISISSAEIGYGYSAWTNKLRDSINAINKLQEDYYNLLLQHKWVKEELENRLNLEALSDEDQEKIRNYYNKLYQHYCERMDKEAEEEGEAIGFTKYVLLKMNTSLDTYVPQIMIMGIFYDQDNAEKAARNLIREVFKENEEEEDSDGYTFEECLTDCHAYFRVDGDSCYVALEKVEMREDPKNESQIMRVAYNIEWETDDADDVTLPNEVPIPNDVKDEYIGDWLSNEFGFLHGGYLVKKI